LSAFAEAANPPDLAFMQGGFGYLGSSLERRDRSRVETLVNVDVEPLWIFTRGREIDSLNQLQGLRVAVGPEGSGTRKVALKLLEQARIEAKDLTLSPADQQPGRAGAEGKARSTWCSLSRRPNPLPCRTC
jgi:TRAP-type uncharacterized transport system substrate-binding protein